MSSLVDSAHRPASDCEQLPLADRILLIEDSEDDVFLFRRLLSKAGVGAALDVVTDGEIAIRWLSEKIAEAEHGEPTLPRAMFIDLKLPGVLGTEVLRWARAQPALDRTLAAICSSSGEDRDIAEAERLGAHVYLTTYPQPNRLAALLAVADPRALPAELTAYVPAR